MLTRQTLHLITRFVVISSAALVGIAFLVGGQTMGVGAIAGGVFATLNWLAMRWIGERLLSANPRGKGLLGILLAGKMFVSMGAVALILGTRLIDPIGFLLGFSGLVAGIITGVFMARLQASVAPAPSASTEESQG